MPRATACRRKRTTTRAAAGPATRTTSPIPIARLDAKAGVVIGFQPAHVVAACADDLPLSVADLDKVMKDRTLLADLKATVK